jgi:REP element-mobilizing transposase RayT
LADSLPRNLGAEIARKPEDDRVRAIDLALDEGHGKRALADARVAAMVQQALLNFDADRYRLIAWCVMPNHVHALVEMRPGNSLDRITHSWKSFTAKEANRLLGRTGAFWAPEYFDRFMRDTDHLARTAAYIEANPVKVGLCENISEWPYSSAWQGWGGRDARGPELGY